MGWDLYLEAKSVTVNDILESRAVDGLEGKCFQTFQVVSLRTYLRFSHQCL